MYIDEMKAFAVEFLQKLAKKPAGIGGESGATVIGLRGELGAGKTTFTQFCADWLGIKEKVTSPTYVILKKYRLSPSKNNNILGGEFDFFVHIDAYRLKGGQELNVLGWQSIISDPKNLIMVEWPELVADVMPAGTQYIDFKHIDETKREVKISE